MNEINAELGGVIVGGEWTRSDMTFGGLANLGSGSVRGQSANAGVKMMSTTTARRSMRANASGSSTLSGRPVICVPATISPDSSVGYAKADSVKTNVWTIGGRGEAAVQLYENSKLIPYVGLNYVRLNTDDYTVSNGTHVSSTHQSLWTVPVGLMFTGKDGSCLRWTPAAALGCRLCSILRRQGCRSNDDLGFYCRIRQYGCLGRKCSALARRH